jgi:hypothetical protein
MKSAVFFDIDGTILDKEQKIPDSTVEAIRNLRKAGNYAFLCSGRTKAYIRNEKLLSIGFDGIVAGLGTYVEYDGEILYHDPLDDELVVRTVERLKQYHAPLVIEGETYLFADHEDFAKDPFWGILTQEMGDHLLPIFGRKNDFLANKFSINLTYKNYMEMMGDVADYYDYYIHANETFMEIVPKGASKAAGIDIVRRHLNLDIDHIYAVGDSRNDLEMLTYAGCGIAMGNATKDAKDAADYITTDLWDDGIWNALSHFGLI